MSNNEVESRKVRCGNCGLTTTEDKIVQPEDTPDLYVNVRLDPGGEVPAGECPDCGALCYLVKPTATPALLDVAKRVLGIIEATYAHDDEGNREEGDSPISGADVVDRLLELEDELVAAIQDTEKQTS